jgi:hypothetical protein
MIALQNMRMTCDSTYLLDQTTDHGTKADELVTVLDDVFQDPRAKAVVFSQWVRMHEILVRRFERRRWGDERTGQTYLKIRLPEPAIIDRVVAAVQALLASLRS